MIDPAEIDRMKRNIEAQLGDYEKQLAEYAAFMDDWREKHDPARQRVKRFRDAAKSV